MIIQDRMLPSCLLIGWSAQRYEKSCTQTITRIAPTHLTNVSQYSVFLYAQNVANVFYSDLFGAITLIIAATDCWCICFLRSLYLFNYFVVLDIEHAKNMPTLMMMSLFVFETWLFSCDVSSKTICPALTILTVQQVPFAYSPLPVRHTTHTQSCARTQTHKHTQTHRYTKSDIQAHALWWENGRRGGVDKIVWSRHRDACTYTCSCICRNARPCGGANAMKEQEITDKQFFVFFLCVCVFSLRSASK